MKFASSLLTSLVCCVCGVLANLQNDMGEVNKESVTISGKILPPDYIFPGTPPWQAETHVTLRGGVQKGFVREDGSFSLYNVAPGSYILDVLNPTYTYEPVRVEISSKGKIRARKVNYIQASQVIQVPYPLKMKALGITRYFQVREQWRITDFLFNPMVVMMVLPMLLLMLLPRMINDPEARKEMEQLSNLTKYDMPEMSEVITSFLRGSNLPKPKPTSKQSKKGNKNL